MAASGITVAGLWGRYLAANRRRLARATLKDRNRCVRALLDWCPVDEAKRITPAMAARYAAHRAEAGISPVTVASEMAALHAIFGWAVAEGLVKRNPFAKVKRLTSSERKPPRVLTDEEIARLLRAARATIFHDIIYTFLRTGLTPQELAFVRWEDVDFERRLVQTSGRPCEGEPKCRLLSRSIPMDDDLARVLARQPGGPRGEDVTPALAELAPWRAWRARPFLVVRAVGGACAPEETSGEGREKDEEKEDEAFCRTLIEVLERFGDTLEEARDRIDPRIVRVREGMKEFARRRRVLEEGGGPEESGPDRLRVMSWLLDSFARGGEPGGPPLPRVLLGRARASLTSPARRDSPYVFATIYGLARRYDTALGVAKCASRAGLEGVTPQVLRHTFAGRLVMNGIDSTTLRVLMGFSARRQIAHYAHLGPGGKITRWYATAARRKELARRMRAAVEGFKVPLPGPGVDEVIRRAADVLEDVAYFMERESARRKREEEKLRKETGDVPRFETILDLLNWDPDDRP